MRFSDFALCAIDELVNQAAKARFMFGGQGRVPLVARAPIGMWRSSAAQHSQSLEAWYAHIPGLVVVTPSTPADNRALLRAAIASDDPVVYMEHKDLWALEDEVPVQAEAEPLGKAALRRPGDAVTIVSWSKQVHVCLEAARTLAGRGIEVEIIDLRSLWPWDQEAVFDSVGRTGRLLVVQESVTVAGFGAEVAASGQTSVLAEHAAAPQVLADRPDVRVRYHCLGQALLARFQIAHPGHGTASLGAPIS